MPEPIKSNDDTKPSQVQASTLMTELKALKETVTDQAKTIANQQAILTSPIHNRSEPVKESQEEQTPATPKEFLDLIVSKMGDITDTKIAAFGESLLPIMKEATKESPVWDKNKEAAQLMEDNPGLNTELALELAGTRMAEREAADKVMEEEAQKLEADEVSRQASLGHPSNTSASAEIVAPAKTLTDIMLAKWDATGMEEATNSFNEDITDDWGSVDNRVQVV